MPTFNVTIQELDDATAPPAPPVSDREEVPELRYFGTTCEAEDEPAAKAMAWKRWDSRYGARPDPEFTKVDAKQIDPAV